MAGADRRSSTSHESLDVTTARRLALARVGLLKPEWTEFPACGKGRGRGARAAAYAVIRRLSYLQLDTVSIAGARSHAIALLSRLEALDPAVTETLLRAGEPIFEYWGHEASWMPIELYPVFEFRRREFRHHPWWGDLVSQHPKIAHDLRRRVREEGPLRTADMEGRGSRGWWDLKVAQRVAAALWSSGEFAVRERRNFQRMYDLTERVIPERWRAAPVPEPDALEHLLLLALHGHGWAATGTLTGTWRLRNRKTAIDAALHRLAERGEVVRCSLERDGGRDSPGWIRPEDLELGARLRRARPRTDRGVLLSPFDPVLWNRARVRQLFGFDQVLEIFKPAPKRVYGYYCLPVLAGDRLVARFDLRADRKSGTIHVLSYHRENTGGSRARLEQGEASRTALERYAAAVGLRPTGWRCR
jgi:uncharacterized protein YcaQ